jgi:hypothetical protein
VLLVRSAVTERGFDPERVMDMFERSGAQIVRANSMMIINKEMPVGTAASFVADTQIPTDTNADNIGVKKKPFWKFW